MRTVNAVVASLAILLVITVAPAFAQTCPDPGSGAAGVEEFQNAITNCDENPAITCNSEFSIEAFPPVRDGRLVTFSYEVCKIAEAVEVYDLNYWMLGLGQMLDCLAANKTIYDLVSICSVYDGGECGFTDDAATQVFGVRFDATVGDGECKLFSVTLDETALEAGFGVGTGCALAATQGDDQDIQSAESPVPGYAAVAGPVCEEFTCPRSQGYWKNHAEAWPVASLTLGSQTYTQAELIALMKKPVRGDASLILTKQLVAAKLNIENGADPVPASDTIEDADNLLSGFNGKLPYKVRPCTPTGKSMVTDAWMLDFYNNGFFTPVCSH
ncbi:hypothetical protein HZA56_20460 [Candidatus Poribacteria bacterium]|nr:hypothetical protein [Candidatus Poribacteria bacterium]